MSTTTSIIKSTGSAVARPDAIAIAGTEAFNDAERNQLQELLEKNVDQRNTIMRLSAGSVSLAEKVAQLDRDIHTVTKNLRETPEFQELQNLRKYRKQVLEMKQECDAQQRGVWASLLQGMRKGSKLYQKLLVASNAMLQGAE